MRDTDLFQLALGITSPWFVSAADFDGEGRACYPPPRNVVIGRGLSRLTAIQIGVKIGAGDVSN